MTPPLIASNFLNHAKRLRLWLNPDWDPTRFQMLSSGCRGVVIIWMSRRSDQILFLRIWSGDIQDTEATAVMSEEVGREGSKR